MTSLAPHGRTVLSAAVCTALASPGSRDQALSGGAPDFQVVPASAVFQSVSVHSTSPPTPKAERAESGRTRRRRPGRSDRFQESPPSLVTHSQPESVQEPARTTHAMRGPTAVTNCCTGAALRSTGDAEGLGVPPDLVGVADADGEAVAEDVAGTKFVRGHGSESPTDEHRVGREQHCQPDDRNYPA